MKKKIILLSLIGAFLAIGTVFALNGSVFATTEENPPDTSLNTGDCTSILPGSWCSGSDGIRQMVLFVVSLMTGGVLVAGTIGIIISGVMIMTARDNEAQLAKGKKRIFEIVIGIVAWVLFAWVVNLIIPKSTSEIENDMSGYIETTEMIS